MNTLAPETDYSQWGEQIIILDFFDGRVGRFLDLGAYDGVTGSNTRMLAERGWEGVSIEASPRAFWMLLEKMVAFPKVELVNAAAMPESGIVRFYETHSAISTCMTEHHIDTWLKTSYWVAGITPTQIAARFGGHFDFVSLDIEGMEIPLLATMAPILGQTELICVEERIHNTERDEKYYEAMLAGMAAHGFDQLIARTNDASGNLLYAKGGKQVTE